MNKQRLVMLMVAATFAAFLTACEKTQEMKTQEVASPACVELEKTTDPAKKAELLKKCPRSGPEFKPSPKIEY